MKFYAINGSPRKNNNTAMLLQSALAGVKSRQGINPIKTELINLYDLTYKPCISCFQCKLLNGKSYGKCAIKDSLTSIMEKLSESDGIIFGSPIYFGGITAQLKSFLERFLFQYAVYDMQYSSVAPKQMPTAFIYTMNVAEDIMAAQQYADGLKHIEFFIGNIFLPPQVMYAFNTYQFDDYTKYKVECFSEVDKAKHRESQFPVDMKNAFNIGEGMVMPQ